MNNSTLTCYLSKTHHFGSYSCKNLWKSRPSYSTRARVDYLFIVKKNSAKNLIFASILNLRSSNSTSIHQFYYSASTRLSLQSFGICLDDESRVPTPLRQYLFCRYNNFSQRYKIYYNSNKEILLKNLIKKKTPTTNHLLCTKIPRPIR